VQVQPQVFELECKSSLKSLSWSASHVSSLVIGSPDSPGSSLKYFEDSTQVSSHCVCDLSATPDQVTNSSPQLSGDTRQSFAESWRRRHVVRRRRPSGNSLCRKKNCSSTSLTPNPCLISLSLSISSPMLFPAKKDCFLFYFPSEGLSSGVDEEERNRERKKQRIRGDRFDVNSRHIDRE